MRRLWTLGGGLATAASLGIAGLALRPSDTPASPPAPRIAATAAAHLAAAASFPTRGAGSCAASACHGGSVPLPSQVSSVLRNEHTTWITSDPHATAYDVLMGARSQSIARNLGKPSGQMIPAHQDGRCLACHATPTAASAGPDLADAIRRDGVGCESCHGPSGGWIAEHTRIDWAGLPPSIKSQQFGLNNLRDLGTRALVCAGCHVGAPADPSRGLPARDVNHDLIAAGHPRLNWEYSAYVANYPKHWKQKDYTPDWDARLWKVGQVATLRAALDLLQARAEAAAAKAAPWPELSEYGCFSCHFALKDKPFRGGRDPESPLGVPVWASWHLPMLKALVAADPQAQAQGVAPRLAALRKTMARLTPDPKVASAQAAEVRVALDGWLASMSSARVEAPELRALLGTLNARDAEGRRPVVTGWDSAAQLYLGLAALHASQGLVEPAGSDPALRAELQSLLKDLGFPKGYDSPRDFDPSRVRSR